VEADAKPLWRKREVVRQERSTFYTTIDANGEQQELVEKETTQSEVLHMEVIIGVVSVVSQYNSVYYCDTYGGKRG
jgi:hypothetical protein